jgi:hypothetical protein
MTNRRTTPLLISLPNDGIWYAEEGEHHFFLSITRSGKDLFFSSAIARTEEEARSLITTGEILYIAPFTTFISKYLHDVEKLKKNLLL